jgi:CheY-like chemotaxis protein
MANQSILVVDDDSVSLTLLTKLVEKLEYTVFQAADGVEAQEVLDQHAIDLVICDYEMPQLNGIELLRWVNAGFPSLPFILVTAYSNVKVIRSAWEDGAFDFFQKPVFIDRLKHTIEIAIKFGHLKVARRHFPKQVEPEADPGLLDLPVLRELAAALSAADLAAIVTEFDVHARIELEQMLRYSLARQPQLVKALAHRLAGSSLNVGLAKMAQAFRTIEANPDRPIHHHGELDKMLEQSVFWLKHHLADILADLAS